MADSVPDYPQIPRLSSPGVYTRCAGEAACDQCEILQVHLTRQMEVIVHFRTVLRFYKQVALLLFFVGLGLGGLWAWMLFHLI